MSDRCCGTCRHAVDRGVNGLSNSAAICGKSRQDGYGENVVMLDDPKFGSKCKSWKAGGVVNLTKHQKKILAALLLMDEGRINGTFWRDRNQRAVLVDGHYVLPPDQSDGWHRRSDISRAVTEGRGVPMKRLVALKDLGLVEPESTLVVSLVERQICYCGCDRWRITEAGRRLAKTWNVNVPIESRSAP